MKQTELQDHEFSKGGYFSSTYAVNQQRSIVEECRFNSAISRLVFPSTPSAHFWSASPYAGGPADAWSVYCDHCFENYGSIIRPLVFISPSLKSAVPPVDQANVLLP